MRKLIFLLMGRKWSGLEKELIKLIKLLFYLNQRRICLPKRRVSNDFL